MLYTIGIILGISILGIIILIWLESNRDTYLSPFLSIPLFFIVYLPILIYKIINHNFNIFDIKFHITFWIFVIIIGLSIMVSEGILNKEDKYCSEWCHLNKFHHYGIPDMDACRWYIKDFRIFLLKKISRFYICKGLFPAYFLCVVSAVFFVNYGYPFSSVIEIEGYVFAPIVLAFLLINIGYINPDLSIICNKLASKKMIFIAGILIFSSTSYILYKQYNKNFGNEINLKINLENNNTLEQKAENTLNILDKNTRLLSLKISLLIEPICNGLYNSSYINSSNYHSFNNTCSVHITNSKEILLSEKVSIPDLQTILFSYRKLKGSLIAKQIKMAINYRKTQIEYLNYKEKINIAKSNLEVAKALNDGSLSALIKKLTTIMHKVNKELINSNIK